MMIFGKLAEMWRNDYVEKQIGNKHPVATPTREKYRINLENHILPRWKDVRLRKFHAQAILDWLTTTCRHVDLEKGTIHIAQRNWRGDH